MNEILRLQVDRRILWQSCLLTSILDAIRSLRGSLFAGTSAWYQTHFQTSDGSGTEAICNFDHGHFLEPTDLVAVFWQAGCSPVSGERVIESIRDSGLSWSESHNELLREFIWHYFRNGTIPEPNHLIAALVWNANPDQLYIIRSVAFDIDFGNLLNVSTDFATTLSKRLQEDELDEQQVRIVSELFQLKVSNPGKVVLIPDSNHEAMRSISRSSTAFEAAIHRLAELNILRKGTLL